METAYCRIIVDQLQVGSQSEKPMALLIIIYARRVNMYIEFTILSRVEESFCKSNLKSRCETDAVDKALF